jgi:small subunit ribosomal protein S21
MKGPVKIEGLKVEVRYGNFEKALKIFSKKVQNSGRLNEYRERQEYEKPSVTRKRKKDAAVRRESRRIQDEKDQLFQNS